MIFEVLLFVGSLCSTAVPDGCSITQDRNHLNTYKVVVCAENGPVEPLTSSYVSFVGPRKPSNLVQFNVSIHSADQCPKHPSPLEYLNG